MSIRIALADDHAMVREGIKSMLAGFPGLEVVAEAGSGEELLEAMEDTGVDLVLSDIRMPGIDGLELTRQLRRTGSPVPVLLLTTFDEDELLLAAVEAGAQGFVLKDISPDDLHEAIVRTAAGEGLLQPVTTEPVRERYAYRDTSPPDGTFGPREVEILRLLAGGYSNREIARSIYLAEGTVKNYVSEILAKLGTRDRTRAVLKAITLRVI